MSKRTNLFALLLLILCTSAFKVGYLALAPGWYVDISFALAVLGLLYGGTLSSFVVPVFWIVCHICFSPVVCPPCVAFILTLPFYVYVVRGNRWSPYRLTTGAWLIYLVFLCLFTPYLVVFLKAGFEFLFVFLLTYALIHQVRKMLVQKEDKTLGRSTPVFVVFEEKDKPAERRDGGVDLQ